MTDITKWITYICAILLAISSCSGNRPSGQPTGSDEVPVSAAGKPNILLAIADDLSWAHTSFSGCKGINTPTIDYLARNGVWFNNAYCSAPSCSASRGALLTGRNGWELEEGACLWSFLPSKFKTYTEYLEEIGYYTGYTGKGWGPGEWKDGGRERNPAGESFNDIQTVPFPELGEDSQISHIDYAANFERFLRNKPDDKPFCFWYGALEPHREYLKGIGKKKGKDPGDVDVPAFLPDVPEIRDDMLDYFTETEWFDLHLGKMIELLKRTGELDNTLIVVTSDNGMPFPRAKANLYDYGTHMPLVICWRKIVPGDRVLNDLVSLTDLAPTFMEVAGLSVPENMAGKSLLDIINSNISGTADPQRNRVFTYRERHAWVQPGGDIYPMRALRKGDYLLIWNQKPGMWPAGDPSLEYNFNYYPFGDVDNSPSKDFILGLIATDKMRWYYDLCFGKRPEYELYFLPSDPYQLVNLAGKEKYKDIENGMKRELTGYLNEWGDLRQSGKEDIYRDAPYYSVKGLESGGMYLKNWEALNDEEKKAAVQKEKDRIEENRLKLKTLGWELE